MSELAWIAEARKHEGLREIVGGKHNPLLIAMLKAMGKFSGESRAWWLDDETPWCGLFVGYTQGITGRYVIKEWFRAKAWESDQLTKLDKAAYGCIVTFTRKGGGHVGYVIGRDKHGNLIVWGGNQRNMVCALPFAVERATGYYWPSRWINGQCVKSTPDASRYTLPLLKSDGKVSVNEA